MNKGLIFHSFNKNINADQFYDIRIEELIKILDFLKEKSLEKKVFITFDDGFKSIIEAVEESLKRDFYTIAYIVTDYINKDGFLNENEIKYINQIGCIIGSHTKSHANLKKSDKLNLDIELKESKETLSKIVNQEILDISIPYGEENQKIIKAARKYYKRIAISGPYNSQENIIMGRISIHSNNHYKYAWIGNTIEKDNDFLYKIKLIFIKLIKLFIPNKIYIKIKNYFTVKSSQDVFGKY